MGVDKLLRSAEMHGPDLHVDTVGRLLVTPIDWDRLCLENLRCWIMPPIQTVCIYSEDSVLQTFYHAGFPEGSNHQPTANMAALARARIVRSHSLTHSKKIL